MAEAGPYVSVVGLYSSMLGDFFEGFSRSFSTRDGFIAPSESGTCIFALTPMPFTPWWQEEKCLFFVLYSALSKGGLYREHFWVNFRIVFSFPLRMGF